MVGQIDEQVQPRPPHLRQSLHQIGLLFGITGGEHLRRRFARLDQQFGIPRQIESRPKALRKRDDFTGSIEATGAEHVGEHLHQPPQALLENFRAVTALDLAEVALVIGKETGQYLQGGNPGPHRPGDLLLKENLVQHQRMVMGGCDLAVVDQLLGNPARNPAGRFEAGA